MKPTPWLLAIVVTAAMALNPSYEDSLFGQTMVKDMKNLISDYYQDLVTLIDDFDQLSHVVLPFERAIDDKAIFLYQPVAPKYHFKRNYSIAVPKLARVTLTLEHRSGDCSALHLDRVGPHLDQFQLVIDRSLSGPGVLFIPETCLLFLKSIERRVLVSSDTRKQVEFSKRPELIGLAAQHIRNVDAFQFITSLNDLPLLQFESYSDSTATFVFEPISNNVPYVVPFNTNFVLERTTGTNDFASDTITMLLRDPRDGQIVSIQWEAHEPPRSVASELHLIRLTRTLELEPHSPADKLMRYRMPRSMRLSVNSKRIKSRLTFVESLKDFPKLHLASRKAQYVVFQKSLSDFVLPKHILFIVHIATDLETEDDLVTLTFRMTTSQCKIDLYHGEKISGNKKAFALQRIRIPQLQQVQVQYRPQQLNAAFEKGMPFAITSSCDLHVIKLSLETTRDEFETVGL